MKKILFIPSFMLLFSSGCQSSIVNKTPPPVACTQEAKLCPDGSYVGRTGPNCEFSACPAKPAASSTPPVTLPASTLQISGISPSFGPVGTQVTIKGKGFTPNGNTVVSNNLQLAGNLNSSNGSTLQFAFPAGAGAYCPNGQACPMYFLQIATGAYPIKVINSNGASNSATFTVTSGLGSKIIKSVGEQEGSFLIQKINPDNVDGLWYQSYPVATNQGSPKTLHVGDDIGYACEGVSEKLISIDFKGQKITFTKVVGPAPLGGCPI